MMINPWPWIIKHRLPSTEGYRDGRRKRLTMNSLKTVAWFRETVINAYKVTLKQITIYLKMVYTK